MPERDVLSALLNRINWESANPLVGGMPLLSTWDAADRILASDWLAAHDREVAARTLEAFDADLHEWYPEDVFPRPSAEGYRHLNEELTHADLTLDVFSADLMRRAGHLARDRAAALRSDTEGSES